MDKEKLKILLKEQNDHIKEVEGLVKRELLDEIKGRDSDLITIVAGLRRVGKSTLMNEIRKDHLNESYFVNFDDERLFDFTIEDFQTMQELLIELYGERNVYFFDEIQNIQGWERFVRRLHDNGKKVYVTGSNASMLSREMGTHLTGRHLSYSLYPYSFREFLRFKKYELPIPEVLTTVEKSTLKRHFNEYIEAGGIPEFVKNRDELYVKTVYENIIYRDIIARYNLKDEKALKTTVYFAASNIAKEISYNNVRKLTGLSSATTIKEYFEYLENSYLAYLLPRFSTSLKTQVYSNKKVYFIDTAIAKILGFRTSEDYGRILENMVFMELKRRNLEIYYHRENKECDFVIRNGYNIAEAIQVTQSLENPDTRKREIEGLFEALETYNLSEGLILTDDTEDKIEIDEKKITVKPIWKWMLE
ncbi:putative ATPase (AAA+ superfamily) [Methanolobus tindarius DSM 2278]|uniref:Putative ATPase (AAA+ superfamily) n=1 Tax=Methanolobus tindarius DSM 2278 TaxID=1090322 RepID=W9DNW3_METTI|nr:ATP-binding protein [Methanolobus tindarius]ETA67869.1 putative ATPase (AAA+ superfamily) [Methanolobus tindarius DSM 2278]